MGWEREPRDVRAPRGDGEALLRGVACVRLAVRVGERGSRSDEEEARSDEVEVMLPAGLGLGCAAKRRGGTEEEESPDCKRGDASARIRGLLSGE